MRPKQNILMKDHLYHNIIRDLAFRGSHSPLSVLNSFNSSVSPAVTLYPTWICHHDKTICALHIFAYISTNTLCLHFYLLTPSIYISTYTLCLHFYLLTPSIYISTNTLCLHFYLLTPSIYISTNTLCLHFYLLTPSIYISTNTLCLHFYLLTPSIYISTYTLCLHFCLHTLPTFLPIYSASLLTFACFIFLVTKVCK